MKRCFTVSAHLFGLASVTFLCLSPAMGQSAYFSLEGDIPVIGDQHDFLFDLSRSVGSGEDLRFVTYTFSGGTNAAGDVIAASSFDSDLRLFDSLNGLRGQDDESGPGFDALLSWAGVQLLDTPLNPDPLLADSYRLNLQQFLNVLTGPWAVDLIGPADAITFTGATPTGTSTVDSLKFGTTGGGTAVYNHSGGTLDLLGQLVVAPSGNATLNLSGGAITVGGLSTVNAGGTLDISGGTFNFNANGNVNVDGGTITRGFALHSFNLASGLTLTATNNAQINFAGGYDIDLGTTFDIQSGADFSTTSVTANGVSDGTLLVDGVGSSVTTGASFWGLSGNTADVTFRNGATGNLGTIVLADSSTGGTTAIFRVESGATVTTGNLFVARLGGATTSGTITVDGGTSSLTQNGASQLTIGHGIDGTATINVQNGGTFSTGTGTARLNPTGTILVDGGTFNFNGPIVENGVTLNFLAGAINVAGNFTVGAGRLLGTGFTLTGNHQLGVVGTTTIDPFRTLSLTGGTFNTGDLTVNGTLDFQTGTLGITGAGGLTIGAAGPLGSFVSVAANQTINVTNTATVEAGATLSLATGGNILATTLDNSGVVNGSGAVTASLLNQVGGVVHVQLGDQLGFTNTTHTNDGDFQLQGGRINFGGSLTNSATGNILGRGTLEVGGTGLTNEGDLALSNGQTDIFGDVANQTTGRVIISGNADVTFWDDVTDSGTLFNVSTGSSATFFGTAGFGIFGGGDVFFEDDVTPGSSPGLETFGGNVHFGVLSILEIEIAGTVPGSEFDVLNVLGDVTLGGTLDVSLLNPFSLSPGLSFEIIDIGGSLSGSFLGLAEGGLVGNFGGTNLLITYAGGDGNDVTLLSALPGDFDIDGDVDGFDFLEWQRGESPDPLSQSDLNYWKANYGMIAPLAATSTAVPEPSSSALLLTVLVCVTFRRRS